MSEGPWAAKLPTCTSSAVSYVVHHDVSTFEAISSALAIEDLIKEIPTKQDVRFILRHSIRGQIKAATSTSSHRFPLVLMLAPFPLLFPIPSWSARAHSLYEDFSLWLHSARRCRSRRTLNCSIHFDLNPSSASPARRGLVWRSY
jgi:hypothetical protein